jgi:ElaA protein
MIAFKWSSFDDLNVKEIYEILALRSEVFVVEQNIIYQDPDGKDLNTLHLLGTEDDTLVAYLRLFPPTDGDYVVFGRVVTHKSARSKGYGKQLMRELLAYCQQHYPGIPIQCSAQEYLIKFYESFGFKICSDVYIEEGIAHIKMKRD